MQATLFNPGPDAPISCPCKGIIPRRWNGEFPYLCQPVKHSAKPQSMRCVVDKRVPLKPFFQGMPKKKYYVVWSGRRPGIYDQWDDCRRQVDGVDGALYKSFDTFEQAEKAMMSDPREYIGRSAPMAKPQITFRFNEPGMPVAPALCVDAACSGNPGDMEYRCVHIPSGQEIFRQGPYQKGTNNIGEFLALVHVIALQHQRAMDLPVYSDSVNAIKWLSAGKARTRLEPCQANQPVFDLLERAERWLANNPVNIRILKWDTRRWGEIPADFGRK